MKGELKILKYKQIEIHDKYYPRQHWSWKTSYKYALAMRTGANFPPVEVAFLKKRYWLIDGKHRLEAHIMNRERDIQVLVRKDIKDFKALFLEAIEKNISHGHELTLRDKTKIAVTLKDMKLSNKNISDILKTPTRELNKLVVTRMTSTVSGKPVILQPQMKHLVDEEVADNFEETQTKTDVADQYGVLRQMIIMIENDLFNLDDDKIKSLFKQLKSKVRGVKL